MGEALKTRAGMVAMAAVATLALLALAVVPGAKAATVGDPVEVEFNHVGIAISAAILGDVNQMILKPSDGLGTLEMNGEYVSENGDFVIPEDGGLVFPPLELDFDGIVIGGELGLTDDATGNYDEATGAMTINPKLFLTLGVSDAGALAPGVLPNGPLECRLSPINVYLSTGYGWPAAGDAFDPGTFSEGAVSGAWTVKPGFEQLQGTSCALLAGVLSDVGGLWLGNYEVESAELPASTTSKPGANSCPVGLAGNGTNCAVPPPVQPRAAFGSISFAKKKAVAKRGKKVTLIVKVRNTGNAAGVATVALSSSNKRVATVPRSVKIRIPAGKTGQARVTVKAAKKKKGKATITAKVGGKSGKATITVK